MLEWEVVRAQFHLAKCQELRVKREGPLAYAPQTLWQAQPSVVVLCGLPGYTSSSLARGRTHNLFFSEPVRMEPLLLSAAPFHSRPRSLACWREDCSTCLFPAPKSWDEWSSLAACRSREPSKNPKARTTVLYYSC